MKATRALKLSIKYDKKYLRHMVRYFKKQIKKRVKFANTCYFYSHEFGISEDHSCFYEHYFKKLGYEVKKKGSMSIKISWEYPVK
jgi:hypothetical protein